MVGPWKVTYKYLSGVKMFAVYRLKDISELDLTGNREYATGYTNDEFETRAIADELNKTGELL